jgi:hypothetical protein
MIVLPEEYYSKTVVLPKVNATHLRNNQELRSTTTLRHLFRKFNLKNYNSIPRKSFQIWL